ncbi:MFS transporter [Glaciecola sp. 1036]|uniref:MFS transporter n=1 Tax=Alteromonadaceae TaxID=72275 RepID=UPI003D02B720
MIFKHEVVSPLNRGLLSLTYFFYFSLMGVFVSYVGIFLDDKGFSSEQIGILIATVSLARILGPNLWAGLADKTGKLGLILSGGSLLALIIFLPVFYVEQFVAYVFVFAAMMMFWTAILPQLEVSTVYACKDTRKGYGAVRLWGSIGFIVASVIVGFLLDVYSSIIIVIGACVSLFGLFLSTLTISTPNKVSHQHETKKSVLPLLLNKSFIAFLLANTLLQISFGSFYSFFSLYTQQLGYLGWQTGIFMATGVFAEIFIFIYAVRLLKGFTVKRLLMLSLSLTTLRWLMLAFLAHHWWLILLSQVLHAFSFGLTHSASIHYLHQNFSSEFQSRAQAVYASVAFGVGGATGSYFAGIWWQNGANPVMTFVYSAILAGLAFLSVLFMQSKENTPA